jgi:hypothetical protein
MQQYLGDKKDFLRFFGGGAFVLKICYYDIKKCFHKFKIGIKNATIVR